MADRPRRSTNFADRYQLLDELGRGGYGTVWRAVDAATGGHVAVKLLHEVHGADAERRFALEAKVLAELDHPSCVRFVDTGLTESGQRYLTTAFVEGETLDVWLHRDRSPQDLRTVALQIVAAIDHAHRKGVTHRDLKPANIMVVQRPRGPLAIVLDFGIAKIVGREGPALTKTGEIFGTPGYMSPEQLSGTGIGPGSDVYSLGVILFELFERRPPFYGDSALEISMAHLQQSAPRPKSCSQREANLIVAMLSKSADQRPTLATVVRTLDPPTPSNVLSSPERRLPLAATIAAAVLGVIAVLAVANWKTVDEPAPRPAIPDKLLASTPEESQPVTPETERPEGRLEVITDHPDEPHRMQVYLPGSLQPKGPAVLIGRDFGQMAGNVVEHKLFQQAAEKYGTALLVPEDGENNVWSSGGDFTRVQAQVEIAMKRFDLARGRISILGLGNGGKLAQRLPCASDVYAATAISSQFYLFDRCESKLPHLRIIPADDLASGVVQIFDSRARKAKPKEEFQAELINLYQAQTTPTVQFVPQPGVRCGTHAAETNLTICTSEYGRYWSGLAPINVGDISIERGTPTLDELVWSFFAQHDPALERQTGHLIFEVPDSGAPIAAYVPQAAPAGKRPFIVYLSSKSLKDQAALTQLADRVGFTVIAPASEATGLATAFDYAVDTLRLDAGRYFALEDEAEAATVEALACGDHPPLAVAVRSRPRNTDELCEIPLPRLEWLDEAATDRELPLRRANICKDEKKPWAPQPKHCEAWSCTLSLVLCAGSTRSLTDSAWAFFEKYDPLLR